MLVLLGFAGIASDTLPIPLAVLAGPDGPNADPAAGADVINTDDGESASVAIGAYETRPDDEESALGSIGADSSAAVVDGSATGSDVGRVHETVNGGNSMKIVLWLVVFMAVVWGVRGILSSVGEMVANIRRVW